MKDAIIGLTMDRSGSMDDMWDDAVGGFNTFKNDQRNDEAKSWMIVNYFDHICENLYTAWEVHDIPDLTTNDDVVRPRGSTALRDAVLRTIEDTETWLADNSWFDGKVYQIVITDGMENSSSQPASLLKERIQEKEAAGWEFIYLAANVDTAMTAKEYGFAPTSSMTYDSHSVGTAYAATSSAVLRSRSADPDETGEFFTHDERDVRQQSNQT